MASWNCVGLIFGGRQELSFHYRNSKVRLRRFVMGRGSATVNRVRMDNKLQHDKWTERDILKAAQVFGGRARGFQSARVVEAGEAAQFSIGLKGIIACSSISFRATLLIVAFFGNIADTGALVNNKCVSGFLSL